MGTNGADLCKHAIACIWMPTISFIFVLDLMYSFIIAGVVYRGRRLTSSARYVEGSWTLSTVWLYKKDARLQMAFSSSRLHRERAASKALSAASFSRAEPVLPGTILGALSGVSVRAFLPPCSTLPLFLFVFACEAAAAERLEEGWGERVVDSCGLLRASWGGAAAATSAAVA